MLMGTPPFQSKTQQEIYTKLRTLEYEWKIDSKNYIPLQAKDFVASCLNLNSAERPDMDELVEHEFFKMGAIADELDTLCLKSTPSWLENADPRGDKVRPGYGVSHGRICRECGVGRGSDGRPRAGVGVGAGISALVEIEAENRQGCAPVIPLPGGILYKQFADAHAEWTVRQKHPLLGSRVRGRKPVTDQDEANAGQGNTAKAGAESLPAVVQKVPSMSMPPPARQYQSFAAQQRQQALPAAVPRRERVPEEVAQNKEPETQEQPLQALLRERPLRAATLRATNLTYLADASEIRYCAGLYRRSCKADRSKPWESRKSQSSGRH
jgi:hypothetical protein